MTDIHPTPTPHPATCTTCGYLARCVYDAAAHGYAHGEGHYRFRAVVVITQVADTFSRTPGNRYPFKPTYSIEYSGMPTTRAGHPVPAIYTSRAEARDYARQRARHLDAEVIEVGFR